jgi:hypothetical protein
MRIRAPGFGMEKFGSRIRDPGWKKVGSGIRDKHPGSATLDFFKTLLVYTCLAPNTTYSINVIINLLISGSLYCVCVYTVCKRFLGHNMLYSQNSP